MKNKLLFYSSSFILIIILFVLGPSASVIWELGLAPYTNSFYSIYLENGDFVYGKIKSSGLRWVKLTDVYYFQSLQVGEDTTRNLVSQSSNILTSPNNFLLINRGKIISIEKVGNNAKLLEIVTQIKK